MGWPGAVRAIARQHGVPGCGGWLVLARAEVGPGLCASATDRAIHHLHPE